VTTAEERHDREFDLVVLAEDDSLDVLDDAGDLPCEGAAVQTNSP